MADDILNLTKQLISIPSVAGNPDALLQALKVAEDHLGGHDFTSFSSNNNPSIFYSNKDKDLKKFKVILNAHLDVVPGEKEQFAPYEKDGKLYGRGAYDMKSSAAVMIALFKEIASKVPYALGLELTTDEERGGVDGTKYQIEQGIRAEFALVGEGTRFRIINESKSIIDLKITAKGHSAHSAYPWLGENAILKIHEAISKILELYPVPEEETPETTVSIVKIETTNVAHNIIPDNCTAYLNCRYIKKDKDTIIPRIQSMLPAGVTLEVLYRDLPYQSNPESSYLASLRKSAEEVLNRDVLLATAHGTSDARYFRNADCDAVEFGPVGYNHHADEEWVDIKSLEAYYKILKKFLLSIK